MTVDCRHCDMDESSLVLDYVVFVGLILISVGVALWSRFSGPKERTKADYVFAASSSVSVGAMVLSIARGFLGVRVFIGRTCIKLDVNC